MHGHGVVLKKTKKKKKKIPKTRSINFFPDLASLQDAPLQYLRRDEMETSSGSTT
jgi:hypothetical protein